MKKSYIMSLITFILIAFLFKIFLTVNENDNSNYVLHYEELNYLVEYCKVKDDRILTQNGFQIIQKTPYLIAKKEGTTYYINCST